MKERIIFSENLRRACLRFRTIAEVCEGIGINRQQFNKYLAGKSMPSAFTLERICSFLQVPQSSLFEHSTARQRETRAIAPELFGFLAPRHRDFDVEVSEIVDGNYFFYTLIPNVTNLLVRSALVIRTHGLLRKFVRITSLEQGPEAWKTVVGRIEGQVFANDTDVYFLGRNRIDGRQLSLVIVGKPTLIFGQTYSGVILTKTHGSSAGMKCCILRKDLHFRELRKAVGVISVNETNLDPMVNSMLHRADG